MPVLCNWHVVYDEKADEVQVRGIVVGHPRRRGGVFMHTSGKILGPLVTEDAIHFATSAEECEYVLPPEEIDPDYLEETASNLGCLGVRADGYAEECARARRRLNDSLFGEVEPGELLLDVSRAYVIRAFFRKADGTPSLLKPTFVKDGDRASISVMDWTDRRVYFSYFPKWVPYYPRGGDDRIDPYYAAGSLRAVKVYHEGRPVYFGGEDHRVECLGGMVTVIPAGGGGKELFDLDKAYQYGLAKEDYGEMELLDDDGELDLLLC